MTTTTNPDVTPYPMSDGSTIDLAAGRKKRARRRTRTGILFTLPFWIGFLAFYAIPMLASVYLSFTHYDVLTAPRWAGLGNYLTLFKDASHNSALLNTVVYAGLSVPINVVLGLLVAVLLNQKVKGVAVWRSIYYLPAVTPVVAYALLWRWMLSKDFGLINAILDNFGISAVNWLGHPRWIMVAFVFAGLWTIGSSMIINLAGLQGIPTDLYDAARVDGASFIQRFRSVTLPMMSPVLFYNVVMGIVGAMQSFSFFFVITQGTGNMQYTDIGAVYMVQLYRVAFMKFRMGYASAMAWFMFFIIVGLTLLVMRVSKNLVYYESGMLEMADE